MNNVKTVVLKAKKRNEYDYLLLCLTEEFGKIYMIAARGARTNSPLRSFCQVLTSGVASIRKTKSSGDMYYINQAQVLNSYRSIKHHELKLASASYIMNLISDLLDISQPDSVSYYLLTGYLDALNSLEDDNHINFLHTAIILRILKHHGFGTLPAFCSNCGNEFFGNMFLAKDKGLFLCKDCKTNNSTLLVDSFHMLWCRLLDMNLSKDEFFELPREFIKDLEFYLPLLLGKDIQGAKYLKMIRGF